jgi:hypothetical protein
MDNAGIFYCLSVYFMTIWYILGNFGIFSPFLVCCTKKNLATLLKNIITYILDDFQKPIGDFFNETSGSCIYVQLGTTRAVYLHMYVVGRAFLCKM